MKNCIKVILCSLAFSFLFFHQVTFAAPTVSLTTDQPSYIYPQYIVLTADVTPSAGTTIKEVYFYNGTTLLGDSTTSPYTHTWTTAKAGTYTLTAKAEDSTNASTTSAAITITVSPHVPPTVSLNTDQSTTISPQSIVLTADASVSAGTIKEVYFYNGTTLLGTSKTSPYTYTWTTAKPNTYNYTTDEPNTYSLTAKAVDSTNASTTSTPVLISVTVVPTGSFTINGGATSTYSTALTLSLTATDSVTGVTNMAISNDETNWTILQFISDKGSETYSWTGVPLGIYSTPEMKVYVKFQNLEGNWCNPILHIINYTVPDTVPPKVALISPLNNSTFTAPANITFQPVLTASIAPISVVYYISEALNNEIIGSSTGPDFDFNWQNVDAGAYRELYAEAIDTAGGVGVSSPLINVIVVKPTTQTTVSITSPVNNATYVTGTSIPITATAASTLATISSVAFYNGTTLLGTITTPAAGEPSNTYSYTWSNAAVGSYTITAVATDSLGNFVTSLPVAISVAASYPTSPGLPVDLVGVLSNSTDVYNSLNGNVIGTENTGSLGTVLAGPQNSGSSQFMQAHFFDTNLTGWVNLSGLVALASTSTDVGAYAFITYANPALNLTPVVDQNLNPAQQTALDTAEAALIGQKQFFVFGGQVVVIDGNTQIQVNDVNDQVTMTAAEGSKGYGTASLIDLSQIYVPNACVVPVSTPVSSPVTAAMANPPSNTSSTWYDYVYCLLDNEAKAVAAAGGTLNLNTDPVMATINGYLDMNSTNPDVAKPFVITISADGQGVDIVPTPGNAMGQSAQVSFDDDPDKYSKQSIINNYNSIQNEILTENPTNAFYVITDNTVDSLTMNEIAMIVSPQIPGQLASKMRPITTIKQAGITAQDTTTLPSIPSYLPPIPAQPTCYVSGSTQTSQLPCNSEIDVFLANNNLTSVEMDDEVHIIQRLEKLGYWVRVIRNSDYSDDPFGLKFFLSLIASPGQILFLDMHGSKSGVVAPFGCIYTNEFPTLQSLLNTLYNKGYLNASPLDGNGNANPKSTLSKGPGGSVGCPAGTDAWGLNINETKITDKALEVSASCNGLPTAMPNVQDFVGTPYNINNFHIPYLSDLNYLVGYFMGAGPTDIGESNDLNSEYQSYPPSTNFPYDFTLPGTTEIGPPWITAYIQYNLVPAGNTMWSYHGEDCLYPGTYTGPKGAVTKIPVSCLLTPYYTTIEDPNATTPFTTNFNYSGIKPLYLYPVVTNSQFNDSPLGDEGQILDLTFNTPVTQPTINIPFNGVPGFTTTAIKGGVIKVSSTEYQAKLFKEITPLSPAQYVTYLNANTAANVPKLNLQVSGATSTTDCSYTTDPKKVPTCVPMAGNPLAVQTEDDVNDPNPADIKYHFTYNPWANYFTNYNGRFVYPQNVNNNIYQTNTPFVVSPYVSSIVQGGNNQVTINFSQAVQNPGATPDATNYVTVDASQCLPQGQGAFDNGQTPTFTGSNSSSGGYSSIAMTLNPNIVPSSSTSSTTNVIVTVANVVSNVNQFPLEVDSQLTKYSITGTGTAIPPIFPQQPGIFTFNIPCTASCQPTCQGKADQAPDGCGGICCVPPGGNVAVLNGLSCVNPDSVPDTHCGGTYSGCAYQCDCPANPTYQGCNYACSANPTQVENLWNYTPSEYCNYVYPGCVGTTGGVDNIFYNYPGTCPSTIMDCSKV